MKSAMADKSSKQLPASRATPKWEKAHQEAVARGEDFYLDPETGYSVWTEGYLLRRGHCCDSGCRHCPYKTERK